MKKMKLKNLKSKIISVSTTPKGDNFWYNFHKGLPRHSDKAIKIAFEFGLVLSETALAMKVKLTPEIVERAEIVLIKEIKENGLTKTALNFVPLIMAVLEIKK